jgi:hypothetical protein
LFGIKWQTIPNLPSVKILLLRFLKKSGSLTIRIFFSGVMKVSDIMSGYQNPDYILAKRSPLGKIILK